MDNQGNFVTKFLFGAGDDRMGGQPYIGSMLVLNSV